MAIGKSGARGGNRSCSWRPARFAYWATRSTGRWTSCWRSTVSTILRKRRAASSMRRSGAGRAVPPGVYFRMLMVGYLEGIGSERGIAWRCADSISLREFLGYGLAKNPPEHSSLSKTRKRLSVEAHAAVFSRVLELLGASGLLSGKTLGVDATTLEANAAMRSIVRRDDGRGYEEWLEQVAQASGIETPTRQDLAKLDRKRPKKGSNKDWVHPHDPEARITKMKDGRTHLAHKFEQAVDMETGAVVAVTVQTMDGGDTASLPNTLDEAERQLAEVEAEPREVVADKGYHSNKTMTGVQDRGLRSYVSEPNRGRRQLEAEPGRAEADLRQPPADPGQPGKAATAPARGEGGAGVRAPAPDRRTPPRPRPRAGGDSKTDADSGCRLQPRASHAQAVRDRHPSGPAGSRRGTSRTRMPRQHRRLAHDSPLLPSVWPSRPDCRLFKPQDPP